jgi:hypothetical protein
MQLKFDPAADRLLWQLRTFGGELFAIWLTRRLVRKLFPPAQDIVTRAGIAQLMPGANVMPEARDMLSQAARERPLATAQFDQPFNPVPVSKPLGDEPLLPAIFKLAPAPQQSGMTLELQEASGRRLTLQLTNDLATALVRLIEQALVDADWGLVQQVPAETSAARPVTLN